MAKETPKTAEPAETAKQQTEAQQAVGKEPKAPQESVYSVNELAANARKLFGTRQECVVAALRAAGKSECTVSETKKIVEKFLKKEVK